ncbi:efflux transporter outer membrane subunit [Blastomonas sp.]|uniref:efflux transporter outer membrane subunit n=1 Tax=Blastomonas sp. TaxID=1909299 RepID=UPI0039190014
MTKADITTRARAGALLRAALLCAMLAGCATVPTRPAPPVPLPERFVAPGEAPAGDAVAVADRWWTSFGDERLELLVEAAVSDNPAIGQAVAQTEIAAAQARIVRADLFPQVNAALAASRQRQNLAGLGPIGALPGTPGGDLPSGFTFNNFSTALEVQWELDIWGRLSSQSAAARADFLASAENLRATRQAIAAQAGRLYFQVVESRAQLAVAQTTEAALTEIERQIANRASAGIAPPSDQLLASANLGAAQAGVEQRREALEQATRQFEILLRDYPAGTIATPDTLPEVPPPPPAGLPADLLVRRPDVAAAELSLHAAGYRLEASRRSFLPGIGLTGSIGTASQDIGRLFDGGSLVWTIAGRLLQPIFQGGRLRAQVRSAEGQRDEALELYAEVALQALSEVETALAIEQVLARREAASDTAARAAEGAVEIAFNRYREGLDPFLNVLEAQQRALDSRSAQIATRRARLDNRINLHLALGGDFVAPGDATRN